MLPLDEPLDDEEEDVELLLLPEEEPLDEPLPDAPDEPLELELLLDPLEDQPPPELQPPPDDQPPLVEL